MIINAAGRYPALVISIRLPSRAPTIAVPSPAATPSSPSSVWMYGCANRASSKASASSPSAVNRNCDDCCTAQPPARSYPPFDQYRQKQLDKGLPKIAANVILARKLARIAFALMRDQTMFKKLPSEACLPIESPTIRCSALP